MAWWCACRSRAVLFTEQTWDAVYAAGWAWQWLVVPLLLRTPRSRWQGSWFNTWGAWLWPLHISSSPHGGCHLSWFDGWHCYLHLCFSCPPWINVADLSQDLSALNRGWLGGGLCFEVGRRKPSVQEKVLWPAGSPRRREKEKKPSSFESSLYWIAFFFSSPLFCVFRLLYVWQLSHGVRAEATGH